MENLIPSAWFVDLHWLLLVTIAIAAMYGLMTGADWLVHGSSGLAYRMGIPKVIIGATVVSLGTTAPECAVSVIAAWHGRPGLALGNAVGSIVADTGLIFGLGCLLTALPANRYLLARQGWVQFGAAVLLATLCYLAYALTGTDAALNRPVGILFLILLTVYLAMSVRWSQQTRRAESKTSIVSVEIEVDEILGEAHIDTGAQTSTPGNAAPLLLRVIAGAAVVVLTSHILIESVSELARQLGVPQVVIAATMVALGTSLPELVVGMTSIRRGHPELLVGNVIGADVLNVLFVIGASASAASLPILDSTARMPAIFLIVHLPAMLLILLLFRIFIFRAVRQDHFSRWMGVPLVVLYCLYVIIQYAVG